MLGLGLERLNLTACTTSLFGMLVQSDLTHIGAKHLFGDTFGDCSILVVKSVQSLILNFICFTFGCTEWWK